MRGVQAHEVNQLIKEYDKMKPLMEGMAGKGPMDRMRAMQELQEGGLFNPGAKGPKTKKGTGKRLSPKERARMKKIRDKMQAEAEADGGSAGEASG